MEPLSSTENIAFLSAKKSGMLIFGTSCTFILMKLTPPIRNVKEEFKSFPMEKIFFPIFRKVPFFLAIIKLPDGVGWAKSFLSPKGSGLYFSILTKPKGEKTRTHWF